MTSWKRFYNKIVTVFELEFYRFLILIAILKAKQKRWPTKEMNLNWSHSKE